MNDNLYDILSEETGEVILSRQTFKELRSWILDNLYVSALSNSGKADNPCKKKKNLILTICKIPFRHKYRCHYNE